MKQIFKISPKREKFKGKSKVEQLKKINVQFLILFFLLFCRTFNASADITEGQRGSFTLPVTQASHLSTAISNITNGTTGTIWIDPASFNSNNALTGYVSTGNRSITFKSTTPGTLVKIRVNGAFRHIIVRTDSNVKLVFDDVQLLGRRTGMEDFDATAHEGGGIAHVCATEENTTATLTIAKAGTTTDPIIYRCMVRDYSSSSMNNPVNNGNSSRNYQGYGGGLFSRASIVWESGIIEECFGGYRGGGISHGRGSGATFTMHSGAVKNCYSGGNGGGLAINGATVTFNGGEISGNEAKYWSGGIDANGTMYIKGNTVFRNNTAASAGGGVASAGPLYISGTPVIENNSVTDASNSNSSGGGGVLANTTFVMSGGTIRNNTVASTNAGRARGAGICITTSTKAVFTGGTISGNTAPDHGAGINFYHASASADISNVTIEDNVSGGNGGGIWITEFANITANNVTFSNNSASKSSDTSIPDRTTHASKVTSSTFTSPFLYAYNNYDINYGGETVTVTFILTNGNQVLTKTVQLAENALIPSGSIPTLATMWSGITDPGYLKSGYQVKGGTLTWYNNNTWTTPFNFATTNASEGLILYALDNVADDRLTFERALKTYASDFSTILIRGVKTGNEGILTLDNAVTMTASRTVTLQKYYSDGGYILPLQATRHISIEASSINVNITFIDVQLQGLNGSNSANNVQTGGGIIITNPTVNVTLTLTGTNTIADFANIANCSMSNGGSVFAGTGGLTTGGNHTTTLNNMIICNSRGGMGGAIYNHIGNTLTINNGEIYGSTATSTGGAISGYGMMTITGSKIYNNSSTSFGGGIYYDGSHNSSNVLTITNAEITGNQATYDGGGLHIYGKFNMQNSKISGNTASGSGALGGGIYIANSQNVGASSTVATISGGIIQGNYARSNGGGIYVEKFTTDASSNPTVNNISLAISGTTLIGGANAFSSAQISARKGIDGAYGNYAGGTSATNGGGGIYTDNYSDLTVASTVKFQNNATARKSPWILTDPYWAATKAIYDVTCASFVSTTLNTSELPGETLNTTYNNLFNNYDINFATRTITYLSNNGNNETVIKYYYPNSTAQAVAANLFTANAGEVFEEWNTTATGSAGTSYDPGDNITMNKDYTLYARWKAATGVTLLGTVFPFVNWEDEEEFNAQFPFTVSLKSVPSSTSEDPIGDLVNETPLYPSVNATWYDGSKYVPYTTPKSPGIQGNYDNYGLPIDWMSAIKEAGGTPNTEILTAGQAPDTDNGMSVGLFEIENVLPGTYILEIKREGFLVRYAKITVTADPVQYLGHRELVPGDVNDDLVIDMNDETELVDNSMTSFGESNYLPRYDLNADGYIDINDGTLLQKYNNFLFYHYQETIDWMTELGI